MESLLSIDLLNKQPEPFHYLNILEDWELEDHDEDALTDEQLEPNDIEEDDTVPQEMRRRGKVCDVVVNQTRRRRHRIAA